MKKSCAFNFYDFKWKIVRQKDDGATCSYHEKLITIDDKYDEYTFRGYLMHELFEAASYMGGVVYNKNFPETDTAYIMDHSTMTQVITQVRMAYDHIVEEMITNYKSKPIKKVVNKQPANKKVVAYDPLTSVIPKY